MNRNRIASATALLLLIFTIHHARFAFAQCALNAHVATIPDPNSEEGGSFGGSVAVSGNVIVVGSALSDPVGVSNAGAAHVFNATTGGLIVTLNNPEPAADDYFGASVAISGNLILIGADRDNPGGVSNAGTAYVYNATTGQLVTTLNNPDPALSDQFGYAVAISGNLAIVGADQDDLGEVEDAGSAYVFNATTGVLVATLNNPEPAIQDYFGNSVGVSGNVAVVGAPSDTSGVVADAGSAYVFNATTGGLIATLNNPDPATDDHFGDAVDISGNLAVIGAYRDAPGGVLMAGTAYVFNAATGALTATLNNPSPKSSDQFGYSVAISGNMALVGARWDDPFVTNNEGSAYVFDATTGALVATIENPNPGQFGLFGSTVGLSESIAVVGPGNAYTFTCAIPPTPIPSPTPVPPECTPNTLDQTIPNPDPAQNDWFGWSVAVSGGLLVAGAPRDRPGGVFQAGTAFVYDATTSELLRTLESPDPSESDWFGISVAISEGVIVVGADQDDPGVTPVSDAGTAYVFDAATGAFVVRLQNPNPSVGDIFGASVAVSGNVAVVGAIYDDPGGVTDAGTAYVFLATIGAPIATLNNPDPASGDNFGISVAISGNLAVVGAWHDDPGGVTDAGTAYVFNAATGELVATLNNPALAAGDGFGYSVAISGNLAVVGAINADPDGVESAGAAYVFNATTGAFLATLVNPAPEELNRFGYSVAISGNAILVGANGFRIGEMYYVGRAYLFNAATGGLFGTLKNPDPSQDDNFGRAVAIAGSVAAVGAYGNNPEGTSSAAGSAYTFACGISPPTPTPTRTPTPTPTPYDAIVVSHTSPAQIAAGHGVPLQITMRNKGTTTWSLANQYSLGVLLDQCGLVGSGTIAMDPTAVVLPEKEYTFPVLFTAPATTGTCPVAFRMVFNGGEFFGQMLSLNPAVIDAVNGAKLVSNTIPAKMFPGQSLRVGITLLNTGSTVWYAGSDHALAVMQDASMITETTRAYVGAGDAIMPNESHQFIIWITAPESPGSCEIRFRMVEEFIEFFGETLDASILIEELPNAARDWAIYE